MKPDSRRFAVIAASILTVAALTAVVVLKSRTGGDRAVPHDATATASEPRAPEPSLAARPERTTKAERPGSVEAPGEVKGIPAQFAGLENKYGAVRTRRAIGLTAKAAGVARDLISQIQDPDSPLAGMMEHSMDGVQEALNLDDDQKAALAEIGGDLKAEAGAEAAKYLEQAVKDQREVAETMLASDALSRKEIGQEEFDQILSRTLKPVLSGELSTLEVALIVSRKDESQATDPFQGEPEKAEKFRAILNPEQRQKYQEIQAYSQDPSQVKVDLMSEGGGTALDDFEEHFKSLEKMKALMSLMGEGGR